MLSEDRQENNMHLKFCKREYSAIWENQELLFSAL